MSRRPTVTNNPAAQFYELRQSVKIVEVSSDGGGCLISMEVRDGRLRIEIYRADDTVDVIAPSRPRDVHDQQMMDGGQRRAE